MRFHTLVARSLALLTGIFGSQEVSADCAPVEAKVVWSYPSDGQSISASSESIVLYTSPNAPPLRVLLDDVYLPSQDSGYFYPLGGSLSLGEHELRVELAQCGENCARTIVFTAVDSQLGAALIAPITATLGPLNDEAVATIPAECWAYGPSGCYDVGEPPPLLALEIAADPNALINIVEYTLEGDDGGPRSFLWPVECGPPIFYGPYSSSHEVCAWAQSIGEDGSVSPKSLPSCTQVVDAPESPQPPASPEGCSEVGGHGTTATLLLAGYLLRRRRTMSTMSDAAKVPNKGSN